MNLRKFNTRFDVKSGEMSAGRDTNIGRFWCPGMIGTGNLRLTAEVVKNLGAASDVACMRLGAILTSLAAPNPAPMRHLQMTRDTHDRVSPAYSGCEFVRRSSTSRPIRATMSGTASTSV